MQDEMIAARADKALCGVLALQPADALASLR
jgi:hypothetical protein